jgi:hypothetical protein
MGQARALSRTVSESAVFEIISDLPPGEIDFGVRVGGRSSQTIDTLGYGIKRMPGPKIAKGEVQT